MRSNSTKTILTAGIAAAFLDIIGAIIVYAAILNVTTAQKVLQSVAAGALGNKAYQGGWPTAMTGLVCHFFIAICFAAFYYFIHSYWTKIFSNKWVAGLVYGCFVWAVMNLLVLPLATGKTFTFNPQLFSYGIGLIIFLVGVPVSVITHEMKKQAT